MSDDINVFHGARQFMHRWDYFSSRKAPSARGRIRTGVSTSSAGNINGGGTAFSSASPIFIFAEDGFLLSIEPGVRALVSYMAGELNLITYTSCEGHLYADERPADLRHIGILPRNDAERARIVQVFERCVSDWNTETRNLPAWPAITMRQLVDREALLSVVDLGLQRAHGQPWKAYFAGLDHCTSLLIEILRKAVSEVAPAMAVSSARSERDGLASNP
jgi:hypothetical protein